MTCVCKRGMQKLLHRAVLVCCSFTVQAISIGLGFELSTTNGDMFC
jgi:hypothetical protein